MAEAIGVAAGLLTFATFALKSSLELCQTVKSFKSHYERVLNLIGELEALSEVLASLTQTIEATKGTDLSNLEVPLRRCGEACRDFGQELVKCAARSSIERTSFRGWAKLKYMGDDVDGFRRMLAAYKATICMALTDATLRASTATAEDVQNHFHLVEKAKADLEDRLGTIDDKLDQIIEQSAAQSGTDSSEIHLMQEERRSVEKCLQICSQLTDHISEIQLLAEHKEGASSGAASAEAVTVTGLEECKTSLTRTAQELGRLERQLIARLVHRSSTQTDSEEERADLTRLRDEWEATRQGMEYCSRANQLLKDNISHIDNYATGDAMQFMVSTDGKIIRGQNKGLGWRTRQVGGHLSDSTVQEIARTMSSITIRQFESGDDQMQHDVQDKSGAKFKGQYGEGFRLTGAGATEPGAGVRSPEVGKSSGSAKR